MFASTAAVPLFRSSAEQTRFADPEQVTDWIETIGLDVKPPLPISIKSAITIKAATAIMADTTTTTAFLVW